MASVSVRARPRGDETPAATQVTPSLGDFLVYLWRLSRPETWMVTFLPLYVGHLLATRELVPGFGRWATFWAAASEHGATMDEFTATTAAWLVDAQPLLIAAIIMGPLAWLATLLINDVHDLPADRLNPRKARSPLVQGLVTRGWAHRAAYAAAAGALGLALLVNLTFAALTLACLALAWSYSAPPLRLKTRPGADVLVNAVGVGALAAMAGWALTRPLSEAPWPFLPQGLLVAAAVYVPTTLVDYEADSEAGYSTFATRLGRAAAYRVGFACWVLACAGAILLSAMDFVLPRGMLPLLVVFGPLLVWQYHAFIGRARDGAETVKGIVLCSLTFLCVNLVFALMYAGLWRVA